MTVAELDGSWQLELHLLDHRIGHLRHAQSASADPLTVSYVLATDPGSVRRGSVLKTDDITSVNADQSLGLRVIVEIDEDDVRSLRAGARVMGKIECGRRAIGYVWLHEMWEFIQSRILFRIW